MDQHRDEWVSYCSHLKGNGTGCDCAPSLLDVVEENEHLRAERQAVLDCINLYGDDVLHGALDAIEWLERS